MSDEPTVMNSEQMSLFVNSLLTQRLLFSQTLANQTHGGKRDLDTVFGYTVNPQAQDFRRRYTRGHIASRVAKAYPDAVWCTPPTLNENEEERDDRTTFEKAFDDLARETKLWHYCHRADILAQLGRYSVLFFGVADGKSDLTEEVGTGKISYLMPFGEEHACISKWEEDVTSPRFGKPKLYKLTVGTNQDGGLVKTIEVHYSRVVHIAERTLDNDTFGESALKAPFNLFDDLDKIVGGGCEMWWLNGRGGLSLNADKDVSIKDPEKLSKQAEEFVHNLNRILKTKGVDVKPINHTIARPKEFFEMLMSLIAGTTGIPQRILLGSERGELASSQDENNWTSRIDERRTTFVEPMVLDQIVELLIKIGQLQQPKDPWSWSWSCLDELNEKDRAEVAEKITRALVAYANSPEADHLITPKQFVETVLGMAYQEDELEKMMEEEAEEMRKAEEDLMKQAELQGQNPGSNNPNNTETE